MVAVASTKTTMKSSVITFEPRQVMLEKQTVKKQKEGKDNVVLLLKSIASYLHSKGFSNTLSAFQSEAPPEIDGWKAHSIDLEDIFQKYLETSEYPVEQNVKGSKDQDSQKEEDNLDAVQPVSKKKKKKSKDSEVNIEDGNGLPKHLGDEVYVDSDKKKSKDDFEKLVTETDNGNLLVPQHGKAKEKKKKKQKLGSESFTESFQQVEPEKNQDLQEETGCADQSGKSHKKSKDKRNKNKSNSESCNLNTEQSKSGTLEEATEVIQLDDMHAKPKDKKKKKHKSVSMDSEHPDDSSLPDSKEETSVPEENTVVDEKKGSKKRKRSGSEEGQPQAGEKTVRKESKITKPEGLEENLQQKQLAKDGLDVENGDLDTGKKRKVATRDEGLKISQKPSPDEKIDGSMDVKERAGGLKNGQMEVNGHVDGLFRKEEEGIPTSKSKSKKSNNSDEPKTVNAFRRVKVEEVKFLDNRLQDNSYWAKDGADIGYGAKAQEVLGQVKGRDFRHEKTKKKRGSYRGGQIDFQAHSIKFNYSDDDQ